jgi:cytoskeletal protein RodZ
MESPGKHLKAERESQDLSLKEVSESTKIPERLLKAIEEDQYEIISSPVYVRGFLDAYARYLGLDSNEIIDWYEKYKQNDTLSTKQELKQRVSSSRVKTFPNMGHWIAFLKEKRKLRLFAIPVILIILSISISIYWSSHRKGNQPPASSEKGQSGITSVPSPLPVQKEAETLTTNPSPEKSQTPRSIGTDTNNDIPSESFEVVEAGLGSGITRRDDFLTLRGRRSEFLCNNQKVYFLTKIQGKKEGWVFHVWFLNGKEIQRREIKIRPTEWTVYSILALRAEDVGDWRVEVQHGNKVLKSLSFKGIEPASHSAHRRQ